MWPWKPPVHGVEHEESEGPQGTPLTALVGQQSVLPVPSLQATKPETLEPPLDAPAPPVPPREPPADASLLTSTWVPVPVVSPPQPVTTDARITATIEASLRAMRRSKSSTCPGRGTESGEYGPSRVGSG
jgi:hypothetical protein